MTKKINIVAKIIGFLCEFGELDSTGMDENTKLVGEGAVIKSRALVELLLASEEFWQTDLNWTSDSVLKTVGALADHVLEQTNG